MQRRLRVVGVGSLKLSFALSLKIVPDVIVEELNRNFKSLVIIKFHHHDQIVEASFANIDHLLVSFNGNFQPSHLFFEKLAVKHCNVAG